MNEQPITDPHIDFGQALAQLAREHGVSRFEGSFRLSHATHRPGWSNSDVRISWAEGRHGDSARIALRAEASVSVEEIAPPSEQLPSMVWYDLAADTFRALTTGKPYPDCGFKHGAFHDRWRHRAADFPQSEEEGLNALSDEMRQYMRSKWGKK